jgi:3-hydroxyisobutyrate dehydrogenase-like beta-hydroxyacid dehydrogenase
MTASLTNQNKIGFIGIGAMGFYIAGRLSRHGFSVTVFDRNASKANALTGSGAVVARSVAELAAGVDVVMSCLANDDAVLGVYTGPGGVLSSIRPGSIIIEMSTVSPETSRELHRLGSVRGVSVLDAPISGSTPAAEEGTITLLCGGEEESFRAADPIFNAISRQHFFLGPSGSGTTMKLVVNTLLGVGMQAIAEAVAFGQKAGLDRKRLLAVLAKTAVVAPAHAGKLINAAQHDYRPQFGIGLMNKDFHLILKTAAAVRASMPTTAAAFPINAAEFAEHPESDFSAIIQRMEDLASIGSGNQNSLQEAASSSK